MSTEASEAERLTAESADLRQEVDRLRGEMAEYETIRGDDYDACQAAWKSLRGRVAVAESRAEQMEALADRIRAEWPLADRAFDEGRKAALRGEHLHSVLHPEEPYWVHQFRSRGVDYGAAQARAESLQARLTACQDGVVAWMRAFSGRFNERPTQARARLDKAHHDNIRGLTAERDKARAEIAHLRGVIERAPHDGKCRVYKEFCLEHNFTHGAEAEELREGLERLLKNHERSVPVRTLQHLLDRVDARDSLAFREAADEGGADDE